MSDRNLDREWNTVYEEQGARVLAGLVWEMNEPTVAIEYRVTLAQSRYER